MIESDDGAVGEILFEGYGFLAEPDGLTDEELERLLDERCSGGYVALVRRRYDCLVAEAAGAVVGFIAVGASSIEELWVRPSRHRQGVGTALFRRAQQALAGRGQVKMTVSTTGCGVPFYEAMGMRIVGEREVTFGPLRGRRLAVLEKKLAGRADVRGGRE